MFDEKQYRQEYYQKNKQKILERCANRYQQKKDEIKKYQTDYYSTKDGRITRTLFSAKKNAKRCGVPFDLDLQFLREIAPDKCPVFDMDLDWGGWGKKNQLASENSPSLDRIIPEKGYVKENVVWVSWKANRIKNNATYEDLITLANWLKEQNGKT